MLETSKTSERPCHSTGASNNRTPLSPCFRCLGKTKGSTPPSLCYRRRKQQKKKTMLRPCYRRHKQKAVAIKLQSLQTKERRRRLSTGVSNRTQLSSRYRHLKRKNRTPLTLHYRYHNNRTPLSPGVPNSTSSPLPCYRHKETAECRFWHATDAINSREPLSQTTEDHGRLAPGVPNSTMSPLQCYRHQKQQNTAVAMLQT